MKPTRKKRSGPIKLILAAIAAAGSLSLVVYRWQTPFHVKHERKGPNVLETEDGRQLLWASGPRDVQTGEWFDVTGSLVNPHYYENGIGKDSRAAIDQPVFVSIQDRRKLGHHGIDDHTIVIGFAHQDEAKAYPMKLMNIHEIVNDVVGGRPVTVGF